MNRDDDFRTITGALYVTVITLAIVAGYFAGSWVRMRYFPPQEIVDASNER